MLHVWLLLPALLLLAGDTAHRQEPYTGTRKGGDRSTEVIVLQQDMLRRNGLDELLSCRREVFLEQRMLMQETLTCSPGCALALRTAVLPQWSSDHSEISS